MTYAELAVLFYKDGMRKVKASRIEIKNWLADAEIRPASEAEGKPTAVIKFDNGERLDLTSWLSVPPRYYKKPGSTERAKAAREAVNAAWSPINELRNPDFRQDSAGEKKPAKKRASKKDSALREPSQIKIIEVAVNFDGHLNDEDYVLVFREALRKARTDYNERLGEFLAAQETAKNNEAVSAARGRWLREAWSLLDQGKDHRKSVRAIVSALTDAEDETAVQDLQILGGDAASAAEDIVSEAEARFAAAREKKAAAKAKKAAAAKAAAEAASPEEGEAEASGQ